MNDRERIEAMIQRTRRYWYEDGLWELATGLFFLVIALFLAWQVVTPQGSWLWLVFGLGGPVLLIGSSLVARRLVERVKAHTTYPRTGYVRYGREAQRAMLIPRTVWGTVAGALLVLLIGIVLGWWEIALPLFFGIYGLVVLALVGRSLGLRRFYALAVWSAVAGVVTTLLPISALAGGALFWLALGLGVLASGLYTLRRYLASAPEPSEEREA